MNKTDYYSLCRHEMLEFIPQKSNSILEIGCGSGSFAKIVKTHINTSIWGIEYIESEAQKASSTLDRVFIGKIEDCIHELPNNYFDTIVMNDVLEHLAEPWDVLSELKEKLTEEGTFVCSIPNVRFWKNLINLLLLKDWKYEDSGILDRTHFRFFTKKSIQRMLDELNFELITLKGINKTNTWKAKLCNPFLVISGNGDAQFCQYACVFKKKMQ